MTNALHRVPAHCGSAYLEVTTIDCLVTPCPHPTHTQHQPIPCQLISKIKQEYFTGTPQLGCFSHLHLILQIYVDLIRDGFLQLVLLKSTACAKAKLWQRLAENGLTDNKNNHTLWIACPISCVGMQDSIDLKPIWIKVWTVNVHFI